MNIKLEIPESFYQGEELCGYYVSPEMKKVWAVQLDLLAEFQRVCEKYNLKWWIEAGTLLGAVRHKGFVPWDDDTDVILMRKDYDKFCEVAPEEFNYPYSFKREECGHEGEILASCVRVFNDSTTMCDEMIRMYAEAGEKLTFNRKYGIFLDVSPIDNLPDDDRELNDMYQKLHSSVTNALRYHKRLGWVMKFTDYYSHARKIWKSVVKTVLHYVLLPFGMNKLKKKYIAKREQYFAEFMRQLKTVRYPEGNRVAKITHTYDPDFLTRRVWNRSDFDNTVYFPFEMLTLPAPSGWEDILNHFYGNWHEYVIRQKHAEFYDTERPYTYYIQEGHPLHEDKD